MTRPVDKVNEASRKINQLKTLVTQYERQLLDTDDHDEARIYIRHAVAARAKLAEAHADRQKWQRMMAEQPPDECPEPVGWEQFEPTPVTAQPKPDPRPRPEIMGEPIWHPDMDFHVPEDILLEVDTPDIDTRQELLVSPELYAELEGTAWAEDYHLRVDTEAPDLGWHNLNHVLPISGMFATTVYTGYEGSKRS